MAWLRPKGASAYCGLGASTLAKLRSEGNGPPYAKRGRAVFYNSNDTDRWINGASVRLDVKRRQQDRRGTGPSVATG